MANEDTCVDCKAILTEVVRPKYLVKMSGKTICPLPRCTDCRATYERIRVGLGQNAGLTVVE